MRTFEEEKKAKKRKNLLTQRVSENELLLKECEQNKESIYDTLKDFKLSSNKTDDAIKRMREIDYEHKKISNKIMRDKREYSELID